MTLRNWMSVKGVVCVVFGLAFILVPGTVLSLYAISAGPGGIYMTRLFGQAFIVIGLVMWLARDAAEADTRRGIALAVFVGDITGAILAATGQLSGLANALGWSTVALYLIFALGFGYYLLPGKTMTAHA